MVPKPAPSLMHQLSGPPARHWRLWLVPTIVMTVLAAGYAVCRPVRWQASQGLVVRDEAVGELSRQGRFDSSEAMKTAQETIAEIARNQALLRAALVQTAGPKPTNDPGWPTATDVAALQSSLAVSAPKGTEFGRTEVIYLSVIADTKEQAVALAGAVCDQLDARLQELRNLRAESIMAELAKTVTLAQSDLDRATARLAALETEVGTDLGELRILNDSGSGDSNLRTALNQIKNDLRQVGTAHEAEQQQLKLLTAAMNDPDSLIATPNRLLEAQPALRRLKEGLVDAQLRTAQLMGKMSKDHPEVKGALANEEAVRRELREELELAVRGLEADLAVSASQIKALGKQAAEVEGRLDRLAALRARYGNLVADVRQRSETLQRAQQELADARAAQAAAQSASLITRLDRPLSGNHPIGPSAAAIVLTGLAGGLATGLGLVFLLTPAGPFHGRRWSDYLSIGRRAGDKRPVRRAADTPAPQPTANAATSAERRAGSDRRSNETALPPQDTQPMPAATVERRNPQPAPRKP